MDEEDRRRAAAAQYTAFENGNRAEWRSPNGHYGYIEPQPVYYYNDMQCRAFSQTAYVVARLLAPFELLLFSIGLIIVARRSRSAG